MSFKENFTREEKQEDLEYDYSAFWTYAATFLLIFFIPMVYSLIKRILYKPEILNTKVFVNCQCKKCKERLDSYCIRKSKEKYNFGFFFLLLSTLVTAYLIYLSYEEIMKNDGKLKGFNPYDILEIEEGVEEKAIKKAFKVLSLKWHPDRNSSPEAKSKFIMITKAYEALTDPKVKENYRMYGNPDGPGSMRVGIALPPFVYNKKNHIPILTLFLIFVIIIFPSGVYYWYVTTQSYDENGIRVENHKIFYEFLNENVLQRQIPFIIGNAVEYNSLKCKAEEKIELNKMFNNYKDRFPKYSQNQVGHSNLKAINLIYASCDDTKEIPEGYEPECNKVMNLLPDLIQAMYKLAIQWTFFFMQYGHLAENKGPRANMIKNMGYNCIRSILEFSQNAHQRLSQNSSCFLQLPYFTADIIRNISK